MSKDTGSENKQSDGSVDKACHIANVVGTESVKKTQIDFSSVNGTGNVFYRKRNSGIPIFIMDWSEDPRKSKEWYKAKKAQYDSQKLRERYYCID